MSLDLNKLENKLDEVLSNETSETLNKFLNDKRMTNNKQQTEINAVEYLDKVNQFAKENNTDKPKQQTAIEWLWEIAYNRELTFEDWKQAKEMQKEQIKKAFRKGMVSNKTFDDYYNETYGGGEQ
jgi:hypothetical protein